MRKLLIFQIIAVVLVTGLATVWGGLLAAKASLFGGIIALLNTGLMMMHEQRAARRAGDDANKIVKHLYLCAVERMAMTLLLFAIGLIALNLMPLYLFAGFIGAQLAAFLNGISH